MLRLVAGKSRFEMPVTQHSGLGNLTEVLGFSARQNMLEKWPPDNKVSRIKHELGAEDSRQRQHSHRRSLVERR